MTESGKVVKFTTDVIDTNGSKQSTEVVRVGSFNIRNDGKYLTYSPETGNVTEIPRQPEGRRYTSSTSNVFDAETEGVIWYRSNTRWCIGFIGCETQPNGTVQQGGIVGYLWCFCLEHLVWVSPYKGYISLSMLIKKLQPTQ